MACSAKKKLCPWSKEAKMLIEELVSDHPWLWTGIACVIGMMLARKCSSSPRKTSTD